MGNHSETETAAGSMSREKNSSQFQDGGKARHIRTLRASTPQKPSGGRTLKYFTTIAFLTGWFSHQTFNLFIDLNLNTSIHTSSKDGGFDHGLNNISTKKGNTENVTLTQTQPRDIFAELSELTGGSSKLECPEPLIPFYDKIVRSDNSNAIAGADDHRKIPKILHLSMKSCCLPPDIIDNINRWKEQLPNYSIFFHDDTAVEKLIQQEWLEFPDLHKVMPCVNPGAITIDIWRILILYKYGGIYSDIDVWPEDSLTEDVIGPDLSFFSFSDPYNRPTQWFMVAEPGIPLMYLAMRQIIKNVYGIEKVQTPRVVFVTGPHAVKVAFQMFLCGETQNIFNSRGGNFTAMFDMKVQKIGGVVQSKYITNKKFYGDIVQSHLNATQNMTRQGRIEEESGVIHWGKVLYRGRKTSIARGTCRQWLAKVEQEKTKAEAKRIRL